MGETINIDKTFELILQYDKNMSEVEVPSPKENTRNKTAESYQWKNVALDFPGDTVDCLFHPPDGILFSISLF